MSITKRNPLLAVDVYKMGHMEQYVPGCNKVYSYLLARSDKNFNKTVFFGLQYYLKEYLSTKLTPEMGEEFLKYRKMILGSNTPEIEKQIKALCDLGYFPLQIKAVNEGTVLPVKNALMTMTNTHPDFYWVVGFVESLILKMWYPITVASCCYKYKEIVDAAFTDTVSDDLSFLRDFTVHDFGYRGDTSEEGAAISGAAHLVSFSGSDTVPALPFVEEYYGADTSKMIMASVPASEHSVMCSFGRDNELASFENMLRLYPSGIVSIVSDTFDVYRVLTEFAEHLKPVILERDGKVVFRPDSGDPETIICGSIKYVDDIDMYDFEYEIYHSQIHGEPGDDKYEKIVFCKKSNKFWKLHADVSYDRHDKQYYYICDVEITQTEHNPTNEEKGAIVLLDEMFGSTVNEKGYKQLNPKVGLIYGDGMYIERYQRTLQRLKEMGYAASNLVIGVGGILRNHSRDTMGFALKATYVEVNGQPREIEKDPITDNKKKSHKGLVALYKLIKHDEPPTFFTLDKRSWDEENGGELHTVFKDGKLTRETTFERIRERLRS